MIPETRNEVMREYAASTPENQNAGAEKTASPEMTPAEAEAKQEVLTEVKAGLRELHDYLQHDQAFQRGEVPDKAMLEKMMAQCGILGRMEPVPTQQLIGAIRKDEKFRNAGLPEFVEQGTKILDLWIHMKGLDRSATAELEAKRQQLDA